MYVLVWDAHVYMDVGVHATAWVWKSEDHLQESINSFYHVDPRDPSRVGRLGGKHLHLLSLITGQEQRKSKDLLHVIFELSKQNNDSKTELLTSTPTQTSVQDTSKRHNTGREA